jgi:ribose 5-phosphate isomerase A
MARSFVSREIVKLGGMPIYRQNFTTDNGNIIIDVHNMVILEPIKLEKALNNIPGIISNGLFAERIADLLLISTKTGMRVFGASHLLINKFLK